MSLSADEYGIRQMRAEDFGVIREICRRAYPHEPPYTDEELAEHHAVYPQGQFVAVHRLLATSRCGVEFVEV